MSTLVLDTTTKTIKVSMSGVPATTNPNFVVTYADTNGAYFTEGANDGALSGTSDVTIVAAPASGYRRVIKYMTIENRDTAAVTLTIKYDNNGTQRILDQVTLQVGDAWSTEGTYDANGNLKTTVGIVNLAQVTGTLTTANGGTGLTSYAAGDMVYYASGTALSKLTIGTNGYVLTSTGTAPQYVAQSTLSVGSASTATTATTATNVAGGAAGSLVYQTGSGATTTLGLGTTNYVLTAGASAPQYTSQASLSVGTATNIAGGATGSVPYQTGSGATTFLAAGTNGQVLTLAGGVPTWAAAGGGGISTGKAIAMSMIFGF